MTNNLNSPVFIIAEAGVNHNGSIDRALEMVSAATTAKVNAVKFQTFDTESLVTPEADKAEYQKQTTDEHESQFNMLKKLELSASAHDHLINRSLELGIEFMSTAFDIPSLNLLSDKKCLKRIKIPSGEITNGPLLLSAAKLSLPIILSTGNTALQEVEEALSIISYGYLNPRTTVYKNFKKADFHNSLKSNDGYELLKKNVTILHCTSDYPASFDEVNLRAMETLKSMFGLAVGLSDHTPGTSVSVAAVALGAKVIEKHFTLDQTLPGPDHKASLTVEELCSLVKSIREVERCLGTNIKQSSPGESKNKVPARKSLIAACTIKKGEIFTEKNLTTKRPGAGLAPNKLWDLLGQASEYEYKKNDFIKP